MQRARSEVGRRLLRLILTVLAQPKSRRINEKPSPRKTPRLCRALLTKITRVVNLPDNAFLHSCLVL